MQGKFFGHQQIDPCPHCGTPLIMADFDDSCYVFPGRLHKPCQWGKHGEVVVSVYANQNPIWVHVIVRGVKKKNGITSIDATLDKFNFHIESPSEEEFKKHLKGWDHCPDCGQC